MPWQRLWLRSYSWRFCSPSSCMCKPMSGPLRRGHGLTRTTHPTSPFLWPGDPLGKSQVTLWAPSVHVGQACPPSHKCFRALASYQRLPPWDCKTSVWMGVSRETVPRDVRKPEKCSATSTLVYSLLLWPLLPLLAQCFLHTGRSRAS